MKTKTLLLLDVQNLWNNAYSQFGSKFRLDYKKILDKLRCNDVIIYAFIKEHQNKRHDSLLRRLESLKANIVFYCDRPDLETVFENEISNCTDFVLGSGDNSFMQLITKANEFNKKTYLLGCAEGLDKDLANEADKIILITKKETTQL